MASHGGVEDGGRSPTAAPKAVLDDLLEVRKHAVKLQNMLQGTAPTSSAAAVTREMMNSLSSALSALSPAGRGRRGSGGRKKKNGVDATGAGPHRRSGSCRRRSKSPFVRTVVTSNDVMEDGKPWRKYGQKRIQDSPNPRSYYKCTHRIDQGCMATKQVQRSESNPSEYIINYFGEHTCRDPSTIPYVIEAEASMDDYANLINFGSDAIGAKTSKSCRPMAEAAADPMLSCSFANNCCSPLSWDCASEQEAELSGSLPLAAAVGSAGRTPTSSIVGSAPAEYYWPAGVVVGGDDMTGGTSSFPSSPSSGLGFMSGSLGSFGNLPGDDDIFGFDP
ncbi:hypothetical protein GUJ93_ZPchr0007g4865 [Zizania palustris]|uniref:WRKY domain-containing protein n=1 Tax=Zizania palustris TaxID=103762 RepID=A0A8J5W4S1_ZIZPA|nr:hypothetical protein GUJ93_ZPchr0007g4865 [Zizania palustris]